MGAILQLERFDHDPMSAAPVFRQAELDAAFADGVIEGLRQAEAQRDDKLCVVLAELWASLENGRALSRENNAVQVRKLAPLLDALFAHVVPVVARISLRDAVLAQLGELAGTVAPLGVRIRCGPQTASFLSSNLTRLGFSAAQVDATGTEGCVEAEVTGGEILWDEAALAAQLRKLIEEMMETD